MNQKEVEREKAEVAKTKHRESIKYMYFSRYLMIRYIVTIFLFCNLMWFIISAYYGSRFGIFAALIVGVYSAVASFEQLSKMHNRKRDIPITRIYLYVQMVVNALLAIGLFTPLKKMIFPFVINNDIFYSKSSVINDFSTLSQVLSTILSNFILKYRPNREMAPGESS